MTNERHFTKADLTGFVPRHDTLVCIDSDGCVFDTMGIKQKQCFHPLIISQWHLEPIAAYVRTAAEFANLYSKTRGGNRFPCLYRTMQLLRAWPEVQASGVPVPELRALKAFIDSGAALGNQSLGEAARLTGEQELADVLAWSTNVNRSIEETVKNVPPFKWVRECLVKMQPCSDMIVVSQTPTEALVREWSEHAVDRFVPVIAGQELGTKSEHIAMTMLGRYKPDRVLMIGDAPGDKKAAKDNAALFYPINPGHEEGSWARFHAEAYDRFLAGTYAGAYERAVTAEFDALLPEVAPWVK